MIQINNGALYMEYFGYRVYSNGKIFSLKRNRFIKPFDDGNGYLTVKLRIDNKSKNFKIHRLLAMLFIPNFNNKEQVNHIDGDKYNNNINNLEWCSRSYNMQHAYKLGLKKKDNSKFVVDLDTGIFYDSAKDAASAKNINYRTLRVKLAGFYKNNTSIIYI
jgi:hypothetical protein